MAVDVDLDPQLDPPLTFSRGPSTLDRPSDRLDCVAARTTDHHLFSVVCTQAVGRRLDGDTEPPIGRIELQTEQLEPTGLAFRHDQRNAGDPCRVERLLGELVRPGRTQPAGDDPSDHREHRNGEHDNCCVRGPGRLHRPERTGQRFALSLATTADPARP